MIRGLSKQITIVGCWVAFIITYTVYTTHQFPANCKKTGDKSFVFFYSFSYPTQDFQKIIFSVYSVNVLWILHILHIEL